MKTITRRLFAVVLAPGLLLSACGKKDADAPGSAGVEQSAPAIAGPFTGVLTMKTTMPNAGTSDMKLYIGPKGMRAESKASFGDQKKEVSMSVLSLADKPDTIYMINSETGDCMALDVSKVKEQDTVEDPYENAKFENLGKERVNGFDCNHVRISWPDKKSTVDLWVNKDILDYFAYARMQGSKDQKYERLAAKLKAAGLDGFPVKTLISPEGVVTELVKVERITPDAKLFEVPANCAKMEIPAVPAGPQGMSKEDVKKMQDWARKMQQTQKQ
ncbi:DUF4412 domain-containing protein [Chlorobaculum thiosulfatiphilum]|uniref:DUF4412 domain-containing protein n=1 Tax=Chlorobaculum thiosulfatiphilum TaxID=115852 RepID=A0A5C4S8N6_CHLTI|nr:DUF4412 domain-containing protein [Chlorobaculum thiosulfatiphilum]TNJ39498.1 DUF4412 domain-containing protein [Chlorobaculum thiosulfatiphilum]